MRISIVVLLVVLVCGVARGQDSRAERMRQAGERAAIWAHRTDFYGIAEAQQKYLLKHSIKIEGEQPRQWLFVKPINGKKGVVAKVTRIYHGKEQLGVSDLVRPSSDHIRLEAAKALPFWVKVADLKAADKKYLAKLQEKK